MTRSFFFGGLGDVFIRSYMTRFILGSWIHSVLLHMFWYVKTFFFLSCALFSSYELVAAFFCLEACCQFSTVSPCSFTYFSSLWARFFVVCFRLLGFTSLRCSSCLWFASLSLALSNVS
ncbi:hypothetical protein O6H91_10G075200 [Diphasiastrum complanatum]|uniref:Uncharacterized protein n=1 Tax=Diphasiastrum complanatum TaxID=34168 RepID=A0ACC2CIG9_DIPCM|nr:hypothetical protein O6H91_10G075200 [Diphasiastrum complanatum]